MSEEPRPQPSLRSRLLRQVLGPLALTWLIGTTVSVVVANGFTQRAFDRSILDDAYAVAANVRVLGDGVGEGTLEFVLTPREVKAVLFDQRETVYFAVLRPDGSMVAGDARLYVQPPDEDSTYRFANIHYQGRALRAVRLRMDTPGPFEVITAQTTLGRGAMLHRILQYSVVSQVALLLLLAFWLRGAIQKELQPLAAFQRALDRRDARDLTPLAVATSTRDVQRLGAAVNDLLERVAQGVAAQREFAGTVAHELRTPLAGIRALATYGLAQKDPTVWREQLAGIVQSEARASHLVDQLLALALADEARAAMPLAPLRLDELTHETVLRFLPRADAAGVDLGAQGLDQPMEVRGQPLLVQGILSNLIDNALRYGVVPGDPASHITVELLREGDAVVLSVTDNGPGIEASQRELLLLRGTQGAEGERLGQGAGLGLSIVARYAALLGARLEFRDGPGGHGLCARLVFVAVPPGAME